MSQHRRGLQSGRRAAALLAAILIAGSVLTGCANDALADQYRAGTGKNYIAGSGVTEIAAAKRDAAVAFSGTTEDGRHVSSADFRGQVLVLNFWYAACAPCRLEAADLQKLSQKYQDKGASFLGVNTHDQAATARSFAKSYAVTYPSIMDANSGAVQLAFTGSIRPNATPTTLVLDTQGRIAARIEGPITDQPSTLDTIVRDTMAEGG
ncbi:MAG: TlpA disulfide reductase family protein [Microbacteriaceae bacterium]